MSKICILTGQPGAGKTTIANRMKEVSEDEWFIIDGDDIRELFKNKKYNKKGRIENITMANNITKYLVSKNKNVIISLVSPYIKLREELKEIYKLNILEVYLYTNEIRGRENYFVQEYQKPEVNFLDICTDNRCVDDCVHEILQRLK